MSKGWIIAIFILVAAGSAYYFFFRHPAFDWVTVDITRQTVTYRFHDSVYTHAYGSEPMGVSDRTYNVVPEDIHGTTPGVKLTLSKGNRTIKQIIKYFE